MLGVAKWFGTLATVVGVIFVGFQYFDGKWKTRIERSLQYVLLYQDQDKVIARNILDLEPEEPDDGSTLLASSARAQNVSADRALAAAKDNRRSSFSILKNAGKDNLNKCKIYIEQFALRNVRFDNAKSNPAGVKTLDELAPGQWVELDSGEKVTKYDGNMLWWSEHNTSYHYAWPSVTWKFFNQDTSDTSKLSEVEIYKIQECSRLLEDYEAILNDKSPRILMGLHEIKHFYAALSICTTSGVCDSFVACEAFDSEVGAFLAEWQDYFELWGPRERRTEYERLHKFVMHCRSNPEFLNRLDQGISNTLYVQQFTNHCWSAEKLKKGACRWLRWFAELGADPA